MSMEASRQAAGFTTFEQLRYAREVMGREGQAVLEMASRLDDRFCRAVELLVGCRGNVIVTGMGKAGLVGQKLVATLASTGTGSHFLHPGEAVHGDLGRIHALDVVLALSFSGETQELTRLLAVLSEWQTPVIAITRSGASTLGRAAQVTLELGDLQEAGILGLAPSTSTTVMLALGDALALVASRLKGFQASDFARFHPGGSLGRQLMRVDEVMRPLSECRVAAPTSTVRDVLVQVSRPGRRTGAIMLVDAEGHLAGLFTDSDLARLLEHKQDANLDHPIAGVMTKRPLVVPPETYLSEVMELMADRKISELPVVDDRQRPLGLVDITDLLVQEVGHPSCGAPPALSVGTQSQRWRATTLPFPYPETRHSG